MLTPALVAEPSKTFPVGVISPVISKEGHKS